jgi:hypothetical protein
MRSADLMYKLEVSSKPNENRMSSNEFFELVNAHLWKDLHDELTFPDKRPLLAHYTSMQTFEKIITAEEIWFSNPLFMNDLEELKFGMNEGRDELLKNDRIRTACKTEKSHDKFLSDFDYLYREFESKHALNTYILCFSEHDTNDNDGLLSMWRGYGNGGSGAALVIDTANLNPDEGSPLIIGKVHYGSKKERLAWINSKISDLANLIEKHATSDEHLWNAAWNWFQRLKSFALFSKHSGFSEEREWRVVYDSETDKKGKLKPYFSHLATDRGIEPKLKLPIKPIDSNEAINVVLVDLIDRIILGPSISSVLGSLALQQMLKNIGKEALAERVIASEIPFRSTAR